MFQKDDEKKIDIKEKLAKKNEKVDAVPVKIRTLSHAMKPC